MVTELEVLLNIVGKEAPGLKKRLDLVYGQRKDYDGRKFSGLHESVLPLYAVARSIFDQLRNATSKKAPKKRVDWGAASKFGGLLESRITGMYMLHLLLLLPFLLFDLLHDTVADHNDQHGTAHVYW